MDNKWTDYIERQRQNAEQGYNKIMRDAIEAEDAMTQEQIAKMAGLKQASKTSFWQDFYEKSNNVKYKGGRE